MLLPGTVTQCHCLIPLPRARYGHCYPVPSAVTQCHYYPVLLPSARYRSRYPVPFLVLAGPGGGGAVRGRGRAGRAGARRGQSGGGAERREPPGAAGAAEPQPPPRPQVGKGGSAEPSSPPGPHRTGPNRTGPSRAGPDPVRLPQQGRAGCGGAGAFRSGLVRSTLWVFRNPGRAQLGRARSSAGARQGPRAPGRAEATVGPLRGGGGHVPGPSWCRGASRGGGAPAPPEPGRFSHAGPGGRGGRLRVPVPGRGEDPGQRGASRAVRGGVPPQAAHRTGTAGVRAPLLSVAHAGRVGSFPGGSGDTAGTAVPGGLSPSSGAAGAGKPAGAAATCPAGYGAVRATCPASPGPVPGRPRAAPAQRLRGSSAPLGPSRGCWLAPFSVLGTPWHRAGDQPRLVTVPGAPCGGETALGSG